MWSITSFVRANATVDGLDIDRIKNIDSSEQTFDDLILADGHKEIVMSLVEMHSGEQKVPKGLRRQRKARNNKEQILSVAKAKGSSSCCTVFLGWERPALPNVWLRKQTGLSTR